MIGSWPITMWSLFLTVTTLASTTLSMASQPKSDEVVVVSNKLHAFYYLWYGNPEHDGQWLHWNHRILPHWSQHIRDQYPSDRVHYQPELGTLPRLFDFRLLYSLLLIARILDPR
jgi:hypothetical protein